MPYDILNLSPMQNEIKKIFIHTNNKQMLGAKLSKYSIERFLPENTDISVEFINVDKLEEFKSFAGTEYLFAGTTRVYNPNDLQSFTLSRFMPPELMAYTGKAVVIDPDIFAVKDISQIFSINLEEKSLACCSKKDAWDTSMMIMNCSKLKHWKMSDILNGLKTKKLDYVYDVISLKKEPAGSILEMPRIWNNLDTLTEDTYLIHMTDRITQPWRTGLKIDFTINKMPKIFGIIPREPIHKLLGKYPTHYKKHPNQKIEDLFFQIVRDAVKDKEITLEEIRSEIEAKHVRPDLLEKAGL